MKKYTLKQNLFYGSVVYAALTLLALFLALFYKAAAVVLGFNEIINV
jgi:hypothetical protein